MLSDSIFFSANLKLANPLRWVFHQSFPVSKEPTTNWWSVTMFWGFCLTLVCMVCKSFVLCGCLRRDVGNPRFRSKCHIMQVSWTNLFFLVWWMARKRASCSGIIVGNRCPLPSAICVSLNVAPNACCKKRVWGKFRHAEYLRKKTVGTQRGTLRGTLRRTLKWHATGQRYRALGVA